MDRIFVTYGGIAGTGSANHMAINYTSDSNPGVVQTIQAGPQNPSAGTAGNLFGYMGSGPDVQTPSGSIIVTQSTSTYDPNSASNLPSTTIATGNDLSSEWSTIGGNADKAASESYNYNILNQNSNSFANQMLKSSGLPQAGPLDDNYNLHPVPGAPNGLHSPKNPDPDNPGFSDEDAEKAKEKEDAKRQQDKLSNKPTKACATCPPSGSITAPNNDAGGGPSAGTAVG